MKKIFSGMLMILFFSFSGIFGQSSQIVKVITVRPVYNISFPVNIPSDKIVLNGTRGFIDSSSIKNVRVIFKNGDFQKISKLTFDLSIIDKHGNKTVLIYQARHKIHLEMLPNEVLSKDVELKSTISPILNKNFLLKNWKWKVKIIKVN